MRKWIILALIGLICARAVVALLLRDQPASTTAQPEPAMASPASVPAGTRARPSDATRTEVPRLIREARRLISQSRFEEALAAIDDLLALDPTNDYAKGVRPLVEDRARLQGQMKAASSVAETPTTRTSKEKE